MVEFQIYHPLLLEGARAPFRDKKRKHGICQKRRGNIVYHYFLATREFVFSINYFLAIGDRVDIEVDIRNGSEARAKFQRRCVASYCRAREIRCEAVFPNFEETVHVAVRIFRAHSEVRGIRQARENEQPSSLVHVLDSDTLQRRRPAQSSFSNVILAEYVHML